MIEDDIQIEIPPCPLCGSEYICVLKNPIRMMCRIQCWRLSCSFGKGSEKEDLAIFLEDTEEDQLSQDEIWELAENIWTDVVEEYENEV